MSTDPQNPLIDFCRSLPGATEDVKWVDNLVFSVGKKMFAAFGLPTGLPFGFKVDPLVFDGLVSQEGIRPAPYLARAHWIQVQDLAALPMEALEELVTEAHRLVAAKLPKKTQRELGLL